MARWFGDVEAVKEELTGLVEFHARNARRWDDGITTTKGRISGVSGVQSKHRCEVERERHLASRFAYEDALDMLNSIDESMKRHFDEK